VSNPLVFLTKVPLHNSVLKVTDSAKEEDRFNCQKKFRHVYCFVSIYCLARIISLIQTFSPFKLTFSGRNLCPYCIRQKASKPLRLYTHRNFLALVQAVKTVAVQVGTSPSTKKRSILTVNQKIQT
jgi:hypothetical protein